jgi:3-isopropylmalate dehydrogenase
MRRYELAVIGGDGIGPEVTTQAVRTLEATAEACGFVLGFTEYEVGARRYLRTGEVLPASMLEELAGHDAILFGAIGAPEVEPGVLERGFVLRLRAEFDQFVNLRPIKLLRGAPTPVRDLNPERCDLVIVRENIEALYPGAGGGVYQGTPVEVATQEAINTRFGVERIIRDAFERAVTRRRKVTLCHKKNVLLHAGSLWSRTMDEVAEEYAQVEIDYVHVDAACLYLVTQPERFDVLVTDSMFGDILSDLGAAVTGGLGFSGSGNIDPSRRRPSMFEPIHGSAPDIAGKGEANPIAAMLAASLLLAHVGEDRAARLLEAAVERVVARMSPSGAADEALGTERIGDLVVETIPLLAEVGTAG